MAKQPKILLLSSYDILGGAARAAYRLHSSFKRSDISSTMLVQEKVSQDENVIGPNKRIAQSVAMSRVAVDMLPTKFYRESPNSYFSPQWLPENIGKVVNDYDPDIINLHWICSGFVRVETLAKLKRPIIWSLHDMWPFTGGCHYSGNCNKYKENCGCCPALQSNSDTDLSRWIYGRKLKTYKDLNINFVAPSKWIADIASNSSLLKNNRIRVIPWGLDTKIFKPIPKALARNILNLPCDKKIILFGAMSPNDSRKGFSLLVQSLQIVKNVDLLSNLKLAVFGGLKEEAKAQINFDLHSLGQLQDDTTLALAYSAADVMVVPSLQEAFGQTASEALACGTPVVAFNATGLKDIVEHKKNGYLAEPYSVEDLAAGICWILQHQKVSELQENARSTALQNFSEERQAENYLDFIKEIIGT